MKLNPFVGIIGAFLTTMNEDAGFIASRFNNPQSKTSKSPLSDRLFSEGNSFGLCAIASYVAMLTRVHKEDHGSVSSPRLFTRVAQVHAILLFILAKPQLGIPS